jgi:hypothetical protein
MPKDSKYWLQNLTMNVIEGFLWWYIETHDVEYQSGFLYQSPILEDVLLRGDKTYDLKKQMKLVSVAFREIEY